MSATTSAATGRCFSHPAGVSGLGALALRRSTRGGRGHTTGWARGRRGGGRRRGNRTRSCWRRTDLARCSTAKAIARSTHGLLESASPARGCCASCGRTEPPRTAGVRAPRDPRREGHHPGPNVMCIHARRRVDWIFAAVRTLERGVRGVARKVRSIRLAQGLDRYGSLDADVARGLALRMDHGSQYLSDHFLKQIRYWGIHPSFPRNRKRTGWRSGGIVRSRSKRSTAESFRTSRPSAPPWPTSWSVQPDLASREAWVSHADRGARGV